MNRRSVLASVPMALLVGGCSDLLPSGETRFEAATAIVSDDASSETGYDEVRIEDQVIERNYERVDQTVVVVNRLAEYARNVSLGPLGGELARFTVLATPSVEVGPVGPLNPVGDMNPQKIAQMVQNEYDGIENVEQVGEREATLLGETVTVTKFSAEAATSTGQNVDVFMHIARTQNEGDFVLSFGVHPQDIDDQDEIDRLMAGIRHPVSTETEAS